MKIQFEFVPTGTELDAQKGKIALDVGNRVELGVLDHHHHVGKSSTVNIVLENPEYVLNWIKGDEVTFVLHQSPDIDGAAAAYLSLHLLEKKEVPHGINILAEHIKAVDQGMVEQPNAKSPLPYEIYMMSSSIIYEEYQPDLAQLYKELNESNEDSKDGVSEKIKQLTHERDEKIVLRGFQIFEHFFEKVKGLPFDQIDLREAFTGYHPFKQECKALDRDHELYNQDLQDHKKTRPFVIKVPRKGTGTPIDVDGLYWVDPTPKLFKLWARTDRDNAQVGSSFIFMIVEFTQGGKNGQKRWILSVDPTKSVDLLGLGKTLNHFEALKRIEKGVELKDTKRRTGYDIPDPWYDGRGHDYTIVDSPINGTSLLFEDIENYTRSFTTIDLFFRNKIQKSELQLFFYFKYNSKYRKQVSKKLESSGWSLPKNSSQEILPALKQYFYSSKNHQRKQILYFEHHIHASKFNPGINKLQLIFSNQDTGILKVHLTFYTCMMLELFKWNADWKLGSSLEDFLTKDEISGGTQSHELLKSVPHLDIKTMVSDYESWAIQMEDMHLSRDKEFYPQIIATFMSKKMYPINILQSDLESVKSHIDLGQYGRILTKNSQSYCFLNSIDQEMSKDEQEDVWEIYHNSCNLVLLNAAIQKTILDNILEKLSLDSDPGLGSRELLDRLQDLRARSMDMVNQGQVYNLSRNNLTMDYWKKISEEFNLNFFRREVIASISDLTEYIEMNRSRSREKLIFILTVLVGPLTLLTDMMGGLLGDLYPGVRGFLWTVAVTYAMSISLVFCIILYSRIVKNSRV